MASTRSRTPDRRPGEQRRGEELRHHILLAAKDVFLETGFERASMDAVAARAQTSKRTLYAHFESKDKLFLAVLDHIRELYLEQLQTPDAYAEARDEAVTLFCGRFLQLMIWESQVRTCRLSIATAERLPRSSRAYFDAMIASTEERLGSYLTERYGLADQRGVEMAQDLLARTVLPRLFRTLLGVDKPIRGKNPPKAADLARQVDLDLIRQIALGTLPP